MQTNEVNEMLPEYDLDYSKAKPNRFANSQMIFVDSHCHIDGQEFDADREEVIERAEEAGVKAMLVVGTGAADEFENFERAVRIAEKYENIFAAVGVHPHDAKTFTEAAEKRLIELVKSSAKTVAWGEIGLDFYYDHSPRDVQAEVFRRQIRVARDLNLPIIIHSRDADEETVQILTEECAAGDFRGGIMHCFGGTPAMAEDLMKIGFLISFAGNVTFKKAENLREAARVVPLERLLIETDCPFLTPVPFRGKRNEPAYVVETAKFLAELYGIELETLARRTTRNFIDFFGLSIEKFD
jgi:TatD DNase family protein